jgi:hypothetical protein
VPIEQPGQKCQDVLSHVRPSIILNLVEKANDFRTLDAVDLLCAERRIDEPFESLFALISRTQLVAFALEVLLSDGLQRVASFSLFLTPLGERVTALGNSADCLLRLVAGLHKREAGFERHPAAAAVRPVLHNVALLGARKPKSPKPRNSVSQ